MKIELEEYNPEWESSFEKEKVFLKDKLGGWLFGSIEHVGSTSVAGMLAKPIVDIMFGVKDLESTKGAIQVLSDNGYCYYPYKAEVMHWFCKPTPDHRTHHLHLIPYKSELWIQRIKFRNILRNDKNIAKEYSLLKQVLAKELAYDRESYTEGKWPFIKRVLSTHY
ncbi:GrpB family protein [Microbulbifer sp. THAF38]|uniref:GrpB family protein n=1 Tax=Microbulbifer sp. THAF38 TaxID=2587856 RepID=UPI001268705B|nr:GrpB family protein [Microbulbifer sp. THAF38]QFT53769.1 dephospho-CoA kinase/protein folding accessory domain-containing protein [Microbulbifer sp. THAF38]